MTTSRPVLNDAYIKKVIFSVIGDVQAKFPGNAAKYLLKMYRKTLEELALDESQLSLRYEATHQSLIDLLTDAVKQHLNKEQLIRQLREWNKQHAEKDERTKALYKKQLAGVYSTYQDTGKIDYKRWGTDHDINLVLKELIVSPEDIQANGLYVLPADSENSVDEKIKDYLKAHGDKSLTLLIPVNHGGCHWCVHAVVAVNGKKINTSIWDPLVHGPQRDGHSCMDYSVQQIVKRLNPKEPTLQAIAKAQAAPAIREAIVAKAKENHERTPDQLLAAKQVLVQQQQKQNEQMTILSTIKCNENDANDLHHFLVKAEKDIREEFDSLMAKKLDELYRSSSSEDATLVQEARKDAWSQMLKAHGFLSKAIEPPKSTSAALHYRGSKLTGKS